MIINIIAVRKHTHIDIHKDIIILEREVASHPPLDQPLHFKHPPKL